MGFSPPPPPEYSSEGVTFIAGPEETLYFKLVIRWPALIWPKIGIAIHHPDDYHPEMTYLQISRQERLYRFTPSNLTKEYEVKVVSKDFVSLTRLDAFRGAIAAAQGARPEDPERKDFAWPCWEKGTFQQHYRVDPPPMRPPRGGSGGAGSAGTGGGGGAGGSGQVIVTIGPGR